MNINTVRVKVNSASQMKIAMTLLQEISGLKPYGGLTVDAYIKQYPGGKSTGITAQECITSWVSNMAEDISFTDFVIEAAKMLEEKQIMIGEHTVEFHKDGVQVGCTFVSKETVGTIYERLYV